MPATRPDLRPAASEPPPRTAVSSVPPTACTAWSRWPSPIRSPSRPGSRSLRHAECALPRCRPMAAHRRVRLAARPRSHTGGPLLLRPRPHSSWPGQRGVSGGRPTSGRARLPHVVRGRGDGPDFGRLSQRRPGTSARRLVPGRPPAAQETAVTTGRSFSRSETRLPKGRGEEGVGLAADAGEDGGGPTTHGGHSLRCGRAGSTSIGPADLWLLRNVCIRHQK